PHPSKAMALIAARRCQYRPPKFLSPTRELYPSLYRRRSEQLQRFFPWSSVWLHQPTVGEVAPLSNKTGPIQTSHSRVRRIEDSRQRDVLISARSVAMEGLRRCSIAVSEEGSSARLAAGLLEVATDRQEPDRTTLFWQIASHHGRETKIVGP